MALSEEHLKDWRLMLQRLQHQHLVSNQRERLRLTQEAEAAVEAQVETEVQAEGQVVVPMPGAFAATGSGMLVQPVLGQLRHASSAPNLDLNASSLHVEMQLASDVAVGRVGGGGSSKGGGGEGRGGSGRRGIGGLGEGTPNENTPEWVLVENGRVVWSCDSPPLHLSGAETEIPTIIAPPPPPPLPSPPPFSPPPPPSIVAEITQADAGREVQVWSGRDTDGDAESTAYGARTQTEIEEDHEGTDRQEGAGGRDPIARGQGHIAVNGRGMIAVNGGIGLNAESQRRSVHAAEDDWKILQVTNGTDDSPGAADLGRHNPRHNPIHLTLKPLPPKTAQRSVRETSE